jgi:putative ABC transport system permease protein
MNPERLYRFLLRAFPKELRAEFGGQMEALFLAELANARGLERWRLWQRAVADTWRHGWGARRDLWNRARKTSSYVEYDGSRWWMDTLRYDLRHAVRSMLKQPATALIVVMTLALAIGANTAVFSAVHTVLLRPLPYAQPDGLVMVFEKREAEGVMKNSVSPADFLDWARLNTSFSAIAAYNEAQVDLTGEGDPEKIEAAGVSAAYFDVFGVGALYGRTFEPGEDIMGRHRVVVLAHPLWRQRFGADPAIVGKTITLNGIPQQVIGVLPPNVAFPTSEAQLFAPLVMDGGGDPPSRTSHQFAVYARLKPGVTAEQARSEMDRIGRDLEKQYPLLSRGHGAHVVPLAGEVVEPVQSTLMVLMSAVAFILLIACINVTNLLLAKAAGRRREMAVRSAIGAGRGRLVRQVLVECGVLALAGSALGLAVATWGVQLLAAQMPVVARPESGIVLSLPILLFTLGVTVVAGLLAGALPAWHMVREDPSEPLKEGGRSPVSLRRRLRFGLIVAEVALTSLLLIGAGLTIRSFQAVLSQDAGIETAGRLTFRVSLPVRRYPDATDATRFFGELESRLAGEPLIRQVGATSLPPLTDLDGRRGVVVEGRVVGPDDGPTRAHPRSVTSNYLQAIGARIREGRGFLPSDDAAAPKVAVVNDTMARRYWPNASPIGRRVRFSDQADQWREVVGIVNDVKHWGLDSPVNPEIYVPAPQFPAGGLTFVLATDGDPLALIPIAQRHVRELDPNLPLFQVKTMEQVAARSVERRRWTMTLLGCFAVLALVLAAAGIYGVMAHLVSLRTPEFGVRLTLGASPIGVMRQVLGEAVAQTLIGLTLGLGASLLLMQGIRTILFGVEPTDLVTLASVALTLLGVAVLAVAVPAYRAMRIDPVSALRAE